MQLTKKHKMYAVVVAAGLGWLVFDQFQTPAEAVAEESGNFAVTQRSVAPISSAATVCLQDRLIATAGKLSGPQDRDPFEAPLWLTGQADQASRTATQRPTWKLSAIMRTSDGGIAIIDGQPVRLGQVYQGYKLVQVQTRSAVFEKGGERLIMTLAR